MKRNVLLAVLAPIVLIPVMAETSHKLARSKSNNRLEVPKAKMGEELYNFLKQLSDFILRARVPEGAKDEHLLFANLVHYVAHEAPDMNMKQLINRAKDINAQEQALQKMIERQDFDYDYYLKNRDPFEKLIAEKKRLFSEWYKQAFLVDVYTELYEQLVTKYKLEPGFNPGDLDELYTPEQIKKIIAQEQEYLSANVAHNLGAPEAVEHLMDRLAMYLRLEGVRGAFIDRENSAQEALFEQRLFSLLKKLGVHDENYMRVNKNGHELFAKRANLFLPSNADEVAGTMYEFLSKTKNLVTCNAKWVGQSTPVIVLYYILCDHIKKAYPTLQCYPPELLLNFHDERLVTDIVRNKIDVAQFMNILASYIKDGFVSVKIPDNFFEVFELLLSKQGIKEEQMQQIWEQYEKMIGQQLDAQDLPGTIQNDVEQKKQRETKKQLKKGWLKMQYPLIVLYCILYDQISLSDTKNFVGISEKIPSCDTVINEFLNQKAELFPELSKNDRIEDKHDAEIAALQQLAIDPMSPTVVGSPTSSSPESKRDDSDPASPKSQPQGSWGVKKAVPKKAQEAAGCCVIS